MRKGENQSKESLVSISESEHRVIIPLYIPNEKDYYKDAYEIFEYCLFSVIKTSATKLKVSVISNNCSESINERLFQLQKQGYIDELIIEKEAIGKINSILKALRTTQERLITITDADVLFCNGWEEAVVEVFEAFPKAGAVCPVPVFRKQLSFTSNIWMRYLLSRQLYFRPVKNPIAMEKFAQSLGWFSLEDRFKDIICTLKAKNGTIAVLGCSHFVATYKREVFDKLPKTNSIYQLGGNSEGMYLDIPPLKMGGYRLSTYDNYAYHLGNHLEPWIEEKQTQIKEIEKTEKKYCHIKKLKGSPIKYFITEKIFKKIFHNKRIYNFIITKKGISKEKIKTFWY
jgi:hypothetical protein